MFSFHLKAPFHSEDIEFFGHVGKHLDNKAKVDYKIYNATNWERNYYNTHIAQHFKK